ncbi:MAG: HD domain-containing protein, partial [Candidatus Omnitrophica bacterium]|nr:HD domain-containing protein [Candidatus Omnitrophota bacterium]
MCGAYPQLQLVRDLARAHQRRVFLVGGFLRNYLMPLPSPYPPRQVGGIDFDFAVDTGSLAFARAFARRIKGAFVLLDQEHGSARVVKNQGATAWTFDFTDFRGRNIREDLARRDFTVNTFCIDITTEKDHSPKAALKDLNTKTIRMVSKRAFIDDPLRLLRAFSLSAQAGFAIEPVTFACIQKNARLINASAMERLREEMFKILHSPRAFKTLKAMDQIGLLERVLPHIAVMYGIKQVGYHHLDVWKHSLEVVHQLEEIIHKPDTSPILKGYLEEEIGGSHKRFALLKLAAVLHDIGKPDTRKKEKDRMTFHGHEHVGEGITRKAAKHLKLSVRERHFLEDAVRLHLRPGYLSNFKRPSHRMVFRYMRDTKAEAASIAVLAMADQRATRGPLTTAARAKHHEQICRLVIDEYFQEKAKPVRERLLTGHDLINRLRLKPSPLFAEILNAVREAQALGTVTTKDQAVDLAK